MSSSELALAQRRLSVQRARAQVEENRRQRRLCWRAEARLLWEKWHTDPLFLLGVGLYWGEGHKSPRFSRLQLSNTDVHLLRVWVAWCQRFLPSIPLKSSLNLDPNCDAEAARRFWEEQLDIKIGYVWVAVSAASKRRRNTLPNGTLNIRVGRGSLEWYTKMMIWLELAHDLPFMSATGVRISSELS
jgi:hypothetical protein